MKNRLFISYCSRVVSLCEKMIPFVALSALPVSTISAACLVGGMPLRYGEPLFTQQGIDDLESAYGKQMSTMRIYGSLRPWDNQENVVQDNLNFCTANGARPYLRVNPVGPGVAQEKVFRAIKNGVYDSELLGYCDQLIDWIKANSQMGLYFSFADEMNGNWKRYAISDYGTANAPNEFKAAWQHIHTMFRDRQAARNVSSWKIKFVFDPSKNTGDHLPEYRRIPAFYPGNAYVDFATTNLYNRQNGWKTHLAINSILGDFDSAGVTRPFGFGEIAAERKVNSGQSGNRPAWINKHFKSSSFQALDVAYFHWFDQDLDGLNWALTDNASKDAIASQLADSFYQ